MNIGKLIIGGIVATILYFLLGWLIYGNLLVGYFKANPGVTSGFQRTDMLFLYIILGNVCQGFLLSYIFVKASVRSLGSGFITGAVIGLLSTGAMNFISYGTSTLMSKKAIMGDVLAAGVLSAIVGAVLALVIGMNKKGL